MLSFFPRGVLGEILNLTESVSEDFPSYFFILTDICFRCFNISESFLCEASCTQSCNYIFRSCQIRRENTQNLVVKVNLVGLL